MNLAQAAPMPSVWNVLMMSSVAARCVIGVGQQLQQRRLVSDERTHPVGMMGDQREPGDGASAGTEHVGRIGSECVEERDEVVGPLFGRGVVVGVVDRAAAVAARVEGDDGVVGGERLGERREFRGRHR